MSVLTKEDTSQAWISELFNNNLHLLNNNSSEIINGLRKDAINEFSILGIPHKKLENYKYTDLRKRFQDHLIYKFEPEDVVFNIHDIFKCDIPELDTHVIFVINGNYSQKYNQNLRLPEGVKIEGLRRASIRFPEIFKKHYGRYADYKGNHLTALNTAFVQDGLFLHVQKNTKIEKPIQIINILMSEEDLMVQQRNLVVMEEGSQAELIQCDHTLSGNTYLSNAVTEVYAARNSHLNLNRMQNEHNDATELSNLFVHQDADSTVDTNTITLHGGVVRNNVYVTLNGPGAVNHTNGLFLTDNTQHVDNNVFIKHGAPHCLSNQLFKGILSDYSSGAFAGKILVDRDAQKTEAFQRNNNIILSDFAKMNTKPQLEIYADDVKCSHGATVGQLDQDALFYMMARGISREEARMLMMFAFAHEVIDKISVEALKQRMDQLVNKRLRGELPRCNQCAFQCS